MNDLRNNIPLFDQMIEAYFRGTLVSADVEMLEWNMEHYPELLERAESYAQQLREQQLKVDSNPIPDPAEDTPVGDTQDSPMVEEPLPDSVQKDVPPVVEDQPVVRRIVELQMDEPTDDTPAEKPVDNAANEQPVKDEAEKQMVDKEPSNETSATPVEEPTPKPRTSPWKVVRKVLIATAIIIVVGYFGFKYSQYRFCVQLGNDYYEVVDGSVEAMAHSNLSDADIRNMRLLFDNVKNATQLDPTISQLAELYGRATMQEATALSDFTLPIGWNLAMALLKNGKRDDAVRMLQSLMVSNPGTKMTVKAQEIINRLNTLPHIP